MYHNIWGFSRSIGKLLFTTKKFKQIEVLLCGFHNKTWTSIIYWCASSNTSTSLLSHYWGTLSTFDKLWKGWHIFTSRVASSIPPMDLGTKLLSSIITKFQIGFVHKNNTTPPTLCTHLNNKPLDAQGQHTPHHHPHYAHLSTKL